MILYKEVYFVKDNENCDIYTDDAVFFADTLTVNKPYVSELPRNHESLLFVTDGTLKYEKNGKTEFVKKGQIGYVARGSADKSSAYNCPSVSYIAVNFGFDKDNPSPQQGLPFKTVCSEGDNYKYEKMFREALDEYSIFSPGVRFICGGIVRRVIGMLYNEYVLGSADRKKLKKIECAVGYIKQNYHRPDLKISDLVVLAGMSDKNLRRIFSEVYHITPHEFLREFRINKAKILLLHTQETITNIALQCGFSDVYSFSHCFKSLIGISPKEYRNGEY